MLAYQKGIDLGLKQGAGATKPEDLFTFAVRLTLQHQAFEHARMAVDTTKSQLQDLIQTAIDEGQSVPTLAKAINDQFSLDSKVRSVRIARTELTRVIANAQVRALDAEGYTAKEWSTVVDGRERETHQAANGQTVAIDDYFKVGGASAFAPGDDMLPPSESINCIIGADTSILTPEGPRRISEIGIGDTVWTHKGRWKKVVRVLWEQYWSGSAVELTVGEKRLLLTPEHRVWTDRGWVRADQLSAGDMVAVAPSLVPKCNSLSDGTLTMINLQSLAVHNPTAASLRQGHDKISNSILYSQIRANEPNTLPSLIIRDLIPPHHAPVLPSRLSVRVNDATSEDRSDVFDHLFVGIHDQQKWGEHRHPSNLRLSFPQSYAPLAIHNSRKPSDFDRLSHTTSVHQPVTLLRRIDLTNERLWNFAVEDDESYTAAGIIVSNCRCTVVGAGTSEDRRLALGEMFLRTHGALERRLVIELKRAFQRQRERVLSHFPSA